MSAPGWTRPLALTVGDCAGVGPELILRTARTISDAGPVVAYGSYSVLAAALETLRGACPEGELVSRLRAVRSPTQACDEEPDSLSIIDVGWTGPPPEPYPWGRALPEFGRLQHDALTRAIDDALAGRVGAIVTAPWHKARLADAGLVATGHTEVLAARTRSPRAVMLLVGDILRVALATAHMPLTSVAASLSEDGIVSVTTTLDVALRRDFGLASPRIALCGLNPHAGEDGHLGGDERVRIAPAIERLRVLGVDARGPYPADTLFPMVAHGRLRADGIVAMYHDQGLAPLKTFHFGAAANVTLGLPIVRTSVDHGTAYDIAGQGRASTSSFIYAADLARLIAERRARART